MTHNEHSHGNHVVWYMAQGYPVRGGIEAHILHYATEMKRRGFVTKVVVLNPLPVDEHLFMRLLRDRGIVLESIADACRYLTGLIVCLLAVPWTLRQVLKRRQFTYKNFRSYISYELVRWQLRRKIIRENPDIIHVFGRLSDNLWAVLPNRRTIFHHMTDGKVDDSWWVEEVEHFRTFAENAARYFAPGNGVVQNIRKGFGVQRAVDVVYTMAPDENAGGNVVFSGRCGKDLHFGILCRLTDEKGVVYIQEALKAFSLKHGKVHFVFAGKGYLEPSILAFIKTNDFPYVRLITEFQSPMEILRDIDIFIHPSVTDAMPMAIVEALMCGKPCIGTTIGGIADIVREGQEGFIIAPHRSDLIIECMERFAAMDGGELIAFSRRARARYEAECRPENVGEVIEVHYRAILAASEKDIKTERVKI